MSFRLASTVIVHRIAYIHSDRLGYTYCTECLERLEITPEWTQEISGPWGECIDDADNLCERCSRNPWHCAKEVQSQATVELMTCKIF